MDQQVRHICGISGGKDSSALAVYMRDRVPEMEYFFCDTGAELPETYNYLDKLETALGKPIARLNARKGFEHWFTVYRGALPSPQMRWCTKKMKIEPLEEWIGDESRSLVRRHPGRRVRQEGLRQHQDQYHDSLPVHRGWHRPRRRPSHPRGGGYRASGLLRMAHEIWLLLLLLPA